MPKTYDHGDANDSIPSGADATITDPPLGGCTYYNGSAYVEVDLTNRLPVQIGDSAGTAATFDGSDPTAALTPGRGLKTYTQIYAYHAADSSVEPLTVDDDGKLLVAGAVNVAAAANVPVYVRLSNGTTGVAAATEAKQDTGNTSLASIDGKTPALGQALAAASVPVVLTAAQLTSLTAPVLGAGTNAIGKLAANSGVTIGAVELAAAQTLGTVTTVSTVTSLTQMNGQTIAMGTGTRSAGTQRVTIATDDVVPITATERWLNGSTQDTVLSTAASLANNALAISSAYTPTDTNYPYADVTFSGTFGTNPTASTGLSIWFLRSDDGGSTYEDGGTSTTPARRPDCVIPFAVSTSAQICTQEARIPPGTFKVLAKNDGSGQTISSGWTLKIRPFTRKGSS